MSSLTPSPPVLVLAPARFVAPLGVMRSLRPLGVRVHVARAPSSVAAASRRCGGRLRIGQDGRPQGASDGALLDQLVEAGRGLGGGAVLLPASDEWAVFVAVHAEALREQFTFPRARLEIVQALTSKAGLHDLAVQEGVATPRVLVPLQADDLAVMGEALGYPLLLKPIVSLPGREGVVLVREPAGLRDQFEAMGGSGQVIMQEHIPGDDSDIWMYNGYFDRESRCVAGFTARKLRQHPPGMGVCTLGVCETNDEVAELSARFLSGIGYHGIVDIDYRRDPRDGTYKVLDVNPRLGGAFRLMVDRNGLDVARVMYLDMTGRPVPPVSPQEGRRWLFEAADMIAYRHYRRSHGLTPWRWLRSLRGVTELATFSPSDPGPFLVSMRLLVAETLGGRWQRTATRVRARMHRPRAST
jgi:D-aspartate ligase